MLRVTQGHESSISLEVFIKSFLLLSTIEQDKIILYVDKNSLKKNCKILKFSLTTESDSVVNIENCILKVKYIVSSDTTITTTALENAIDDIQEGDVLITMPSSKDQIFYNRLACSGHTDYFRKRYDDHSISMMFKNKWETLLLLTDHIPLSAVSTSITKDLILAKVSAVVDHLKSQCEHVAFSGINPHAGENGLLGFEDSVITDSIIELKKKYSSISFEGPYAGDSLHTVSERSTLKVYSYHDQGLSLFKGLYGFEGMNITIGLPYKRVSVDHGTAFNLYGKNQANYMGCFSMLKTCLNQR